MTDRPPTSISPDQPPPPEPLPRGKRSRLRRFFLRHLPLSLATAAVLLVLAAVAAYFIASSAAFENLVRKRIIAQIEMATGGRTQIASFHWHLLALEAEAGGVVIHGTEDPGEAPYAQIDRLRVQVSIFGFFTPHISLRNLEIDRPQLHFIVYRDGSTNQPRPHGPQQHGKSTLQTLFDLRAGQVLVEQGNLDFDDRAAAFDAQNRFLPLDFKADDVSLQLIYVPGSFRAPESYRVNAAAEDLVLARQLPRKQSPPVHGKFQLALDLQRNHAVLRSFQLTSRSGGEQDRALQVTGTLDDFTHPRWQAKIDGDLDMRLLDPVTGYSDSPEGIAHLHLAAGGTAPAFQISGDVHVDGGSYLGAGMNATGVNLDARIDADRGKLLITQIVARMRQGGQIEGSVALAPWLPGPKVVPAQITAPIGAPGSEDSLRARNVLVHPALIPIPMNGKVTANFKGVSLDTILNIVSPSQYRRLGFAARVDGPANATWSNGDVRTIVVSSTLALSPLQPTPEGEAPATGVVDATYSQRNGGVDLRELELQLPASDFTARGALGAYPVTSASALTVDFHSHDLSEFDAVLRSLGLERNGRSGTEALPAVLTGQGDFRGTWTGSLIRPHIAGTLKATQIAVEVPSVAGDSSQPRPELHFVHFDSVNAEGSYAPSQISIQHAQLTRGDSKIVLSGTLDASTGPPAAPRRRFAVSPQPTYDGDSVLRAQVDATHIDVADLQPFFAQNLPVTGNFDTQFTADGPLRAPAASGSLQMDNGVVYGEPVTQIRVQAALAGNRLKVVSAHATDAGGSISGSGNYDFDAGTFNVDAHASQIDIARIAWVGRHNYEAAGKLSVDLTGSGSLDDPRLNARATVDSLALGGQRFGAFEIAAHTAGHQLAYDAVTQLQGADLHLKGQTELRKGYATQASVEFSQFNVGALLRMAHVTAFSADSALAGTITLDGPLSDIKQLRGDAQLRQLAVTVAGVHLQSEGGMHATLADGRVRLDPLHVTGDNTDLRADGSLSLEGSQQLDLAASGSVNLKLAETLDPDLTASGVTTFHLEAHGPLRNPGLQGSVEFQDGSLSLEDLPNGLSQLRGTLEFNQNRLEVKSLTAMTGGGQLAVEGYLAYQHGIFADLIVTGKSVHIRYPSGVSSLADLQAAAPGPAIEPPP